MEAKKKKMNQIGTKDFQRKDMERDLIYWSIYRFKLEPQICAKKIY